MVHHKVHTSVDFLSGIALYPPVQVRHAYSCIYNRKCRG